MEIFPSGRKPEAKTVTTVRITEAFPHLIPSTEVSNPDLECSTVLLFTTKLGEACLPFMLHERVAAGLDMLDVHIRFIMWPSV